MSIRDYQGQLPPLLRPCANCGGTGDYYESHDYRYYAECTRCGMRTRLYAWCSGAAREWNRRISDGARIVTLDELALSDNMQGDDRDVVAVWIETRKGQLDAALILIGIDFGDKTVDIRYFDGEGRLRREEIDREGYDWRLWDRRPTNEQRSAAAWDGPAWREIRKIMAEDQEEIRKIMAEDQEELRG